MRNALCLKASIVIFFAALAACTKEKAPGSLGPEEAALVMTLGFDESLALELRKAGNGPFHSSQGRTRISNRSMPRV